jgi:alkaline phosphatase D
VIVSGSFNLDWIEFEGPTGSGSVPAAPAGPSVRSRTASSVTVGWDGTGADRYAVRVDDRETTVPGDTTTATVAGLDPGAEYEIAVVALSGGTASPAATTTARTAADVAPIDGAEPTDPDGDGHYEDLNGSGDVDYDDVVTYFRRMDEPILTRHVGAYDYDGNGRIDYTDLVDLFEDVD